MAEQPTKKKPPGKAPILPGAPWAPSEWKPADATALQALVRGDCPPHLQQRAINFIIYKLCGTYDPAFHTGPGGERLTDFALGKQFVGQQIVGLLKVKTNGEGEQS